MANTQDNMNENMLDTAYQNGAGEDMLDFVKIKVVGVGGGGNNAVSRMAEYKIPKIELININTDTDSMLESKADRNIQIGKNITRGQGAGSDPITGKKAADDSRDAIAKAFEDAETVFITASMGGGTGTGAAPVVAGIAREAGALTIGVVTTPFRFEGAAKMRRAEEGIKELLAKVDSLFVIHNDNIKKVSKEKITFNNAFKLADSVLNNAVTNIAYLLRKVQNINIDFADLKTIMKNGGMAHLGVGGGSGVNKVKEAGETAFYNSLMGTSIEGAKRVLINIVTSSEGSMEETDAIGEMAYALADPNANIIFGYDTDESLGDEMRIIVIAADFEEENKPKERERQETADSESENVPAADAAAPTENDDANGWDTIINEIFNRD